jgi:hypothetical protein
MNSFSINSVKSCDGYLAWKRSKKVWTTKLYWYKVHLHRTSYEKIMKFFMQSFTAGSLYEPVVIVSPLPVQVKNQQRWSNIITGSSKKPAVIGIDSDSPNIIVSSNHEPAVMGWQTLSLPVRKKPIVMDRLWWSVL